MSFEIEGQLHKKFDTEAKTDSFQAREFVISTEGAYPQFVKFQLTQDRCSIIDNYQEGEKIKVFFDLRGREWQGKFFTNLNAWRVDKAAAPMEIENSTSSNDVPPSGFDEFDSNSTPAGPPALDDLPF